ncbi:hypothetical protein [Amycolatopsis sp. NPDC051071]|uniref:hypothetical protein n=1 Tax=Amycolatopsis sp. NPDC051071 TaxID=3154637 RepID=UPI0034286B4B
MTIRDLRPWQRLHNILWEGQIWGFPPFGSDSPMVCLSERPLEHQRWLLLHRYMPPWGLLLRWQAVYDSAAGPVWYTPTEQLATLPGPGLTACATHVSTRAMPVPIGVRRRSSSVHDEADPGADRPARPRRRLSR